MHAIFHLPAPGRSPRGEIIVRLIYVIIGVFQVLNRAPRSPFGLVEALQHQTSSGLSIPCSKRLYPGWVDHWPTLLRPRVGKKRGGQAKSMIDDQTTKIPNF